MSATIITIDGPSGVGKGTIAALLAKQYGFHLLDSGALYRLTAVNALRLGLDPDSATEAEKAVADLDVRFANDKVYLHGEEVTEAIRTEAAGIAASKVAVHPAVRDKLFDFMQNFVREPGIVADGRDMGTTVFPQASLKLFLTASAEVRAERRYKQLKGNGKDAILSDVLFDLAERDKRDSQRATSPLTPAKDAVAIDTGTMDIPQVFGIVQKLVEERGLSPSNFST
ncbi:MAG: cytidylate kinase [Cardiobacteriales bacterium]|nr:MAG: cytidylate kinase [Cardiobacteriales bacterium]